MRRVVFCIVSCIVVAVAASCGDSTSNGQPATGGSGGSGGTGPATCGTGTVACDEGCCSCPPADQLVRLGLDTKEAAVTASLQDLDGDGRADLVIAGARGLRVYRAGTCGSFSSSTKVLPDSAFAALQPAAVREDKPGLLAMTGDGELYGLAGAQLGTVVYGALSIARDIDSMLAMNLDGDGDHDLVVFTGGYSQARWVENDGASFHERGEQDLPGGITRAVAGDLGGGPRGELLYLGVGLQLATGAADFDVSTVKHLDDAPTAAAAIAEADGDGKPDAWVGSGNNLIVWTGDGDGGLTQGRTIDTRGHIVEVVGMKHSAPRVAFAQEGGTVGVLTRAADGQYAVQTRSLDGALLRLLAGDVNGDGEDDVLVVTADGSAWVWISVP